MSLLLSFSNLEYLTSCWYKIQINHILSPKNELNECLDNYIMLSFSSGEATLIQNCHTGVASPTLPGARCSQCSRPVWQQWLCAGQRHGDKRERQQVMVPVQLRQRVDVARESKLCLTGIVVKWNLWSVRPKVNASPRIPKGQSLFARGHVKAHEQLAHRVDVKDVR